MSQDRNEINILIRHRIQEAEETIEDVKLLIENDRLRAAINRIYYGMFYSLLALGLAYGFETSKHPQLIGWFNKNFIHEKEIEPEYGKMINKAYNRRTKGDYDVYVDFDKDVIIEMFDDMKDFISRIKKYLDID
jgi:uncharacterized protein (UPF0332 family)